MLDSLSVLRAQILKVLRNPSVVKSESADRLSLQDEQWFIVENLVENLKHLKVMFALLLRVIDLECLQMCFQFQIATDYLEGEKYVSVSALIPIIKGLAEKYSPCSTDSLIFAEFKTNILIQLKKRYEFVFNKFDIGHSSPYAHLFMATWLDPKFRRTYYIKLLQLQVIQALR